MYVVYLVGCGVVVLRLFGFRFLIGVCWWFVFDCYRFVDCCGFGWLITCGSLFIGLLDDVGFYCLPALVGGLLIEVLGFVVLQIVLDGFVKLGLLLAFCAYLILRGLWVRCGRFVGHCVFCLWFSCLSFCGFSLILLVWWMVVFPICLDFCCLLLFNLCICVVLLVT